MLENIKTESPQEKLKVLLAYDGSPYSDAALDDLRRAGLPSAVEAVVLTVADVLMPQYKTPDPSLPAHVIADIEKARAPFLQAVERARDTATRAAARLQEFFPDWQVQVEASAASPARGILKKAEAWKPDLVVLGAQGQSTLGARLLGSVSQKVVTEARCSVRIGRRRTTTPSEELAAESVDAAPPRLVIGWDGSLDAQAAVSNLITRTWPAGSAVQIVAVSDSHSSVGIARQFPELAQWIEEDAAGDEFAWLHKMAESAAQRLRNAGLDASVVAKHGNPKRVLLEEAQHWGADCIFLGAQGLARSYGSPDLMRRLERLWVGSTATGVAALAPCAVEIVRSAPTEKAESRPVSVPMTESAGPQKVHEIMTSDVVSVRAATTVEEIARLLTTHRISSVPVVDDENRVIGIVGEAELFLKEQGVPFSLVKAPMLFQQWADPHRLAEIYEKSRCHTARDVMSHTVSSVDVEDDIGKVARLMYQHKLTHIPVLREGKLAGIVTRADLIGLLAQQQ